MSDDYQTLNDGQLLSGYVVEQCLAIFNVSNTYQILSVEKSSVIINYQQLTNEFIESVIFVKDQIVMPIVRHNHFVLCIINFVNKQIIVIDPFGQEELKKNDIL